MNDPTVGLASLVGLFAVVASGAVLPVVPTGAAVSASAALAEHGNLPTVGLVVAFGAAGAYVSDLATYAVLRLLGRRANADSSRLGRWLDRHHTEAALVRFEHQIDQHELRTLLLSRLVPGGQLPVLIAAALGGYPWRRYASADIGAAILWSTTYAITGLAGRAVFPKAWEGVAAGIALVLVISVASALVTRRRHGKSTAAPS